MERSRGRAAPVGAAVVVLVATSVLATTPDGAGGVPPGAVPAVATIPVPVPVAASPGVAFALDHDALAEVDLTFPVEPQGSAGEALVGAEVGDPQADGGSGRAHEGESSSLDGGGPGFAEAYAAVVSDDGTGTVDVVVRRLPAADSSDEPRPAWESVRVTCDAAQETHPVLSADGSLVAYATDASGDWEVVVAPVGEECSGASAASPVPGPGSDELWPAWGPDDRSLFFSSTRDDPLGDVHAVRLAWDGGTTERAAAAAEPVVVPEGPVVRLTDHPGADTMPTVLGDDEGGLLVLFTTTRFRAEGSVATFSLDYTWEYGDEEAVPSPVSDPWCTYTPDPGVPCYYPVGGDFPDVGTEPAARFVRLDSGGTGILLAWTVPDATLAEPTVWVAYLDGSGEVRDAWRVPAAQAASHPDWVETTSTGEGGEGAVPGTARLRFTQRTGARVVADAAVPVGGAGASSTVQSLTGGSGTGTGAVPRLDDTAPAYAPDGTRVAFSALGAEGAPEDRETGRRSIDVVDTGTLGVSTLVPFGLYGLTNPDWSPDGSRVAYSGVDGPRERLGTGWTDVVPGSQGWEPDDGSATWRGGLHPSWSPDGQRVVAEPGTLDGSGSTTPYLATLEVGAEGWTPLTLEVVRPGCKRYAEQDRCETFVAWLLGRDPAWSPDGTQIAVTGLQLAGSASPTGFEPNGYLLDVAPGGISVVDVVPADRMNDTSSDDLPRVTGVRAVTGFDADGEVRTTQPDVVPTPSPTETPGPEPAAPVAVTPSRDRVASSDGPAWSPDGTEIVFSGQPTGRPDDRDLYAVAPDGTGLRLVVDSPAALTAPDVQPVGDLAVDLSTDLPEIEVGGTARITATVTNEGTVPATPDALLVLPRGSRPGALPAGCASAPGTAAGTTVVTCRLEGPLAPGAVDAVVVPVVADAPGALDVTGAVVNPGAERDVADNTASVALVVTGDATAPRLEVDVAVSAPRAWVGGTGVEVTVTVRNAGATTATGLVLTATYPPGTRPSTTTGDGAPAGGATSDECLGAWGTCPLADLAPGGEIVVVSVLDPVGPAAGAGTITASVAGHGGPALSSEGFPAPDLAPGAAGPGAVSAEGSASLEVQQPWVRLLPEVLRPGKVVLAYGEDFPPDADVHVTWSAGITTAPGPYRTNADGRLSVPVVVVSNDVRGERWLRVTSGPATSLRPLLGGGFPREVVVPQGPDDLPVAPACLDDPAFAPAPGEASSELPAATPARLWCEVDVPFLVVTPSLGAPDFLERG